MEEGTKTIGGFLILGAFAFGFMFAILGWCSGVVFVQDTVEYKEGYSLGYSEHNDTKYHAACDIDDMWIAYTNEQGCYALGYLRGYDAYMVEEKARAWGNERNETARILGV